MSRDAYFPKKLEPLFSPQRYKIAYGGRGGGKSQNFARALLLLGCGAIDGVRRRLRILCAREIQNSIKESVHELLASQIMALGLQAQYRIEQRKISCVTTGTEFLFEGLHRNIHKIRSMEAIDIVWVEEAEPITKKLWEILIPTLRLDPPHGPFGTGSEIWISFNPELASSYTYQRFVINPPSDSFVVKLTHADNRFFPEVLARERDEMRERDQDAYLNIWEGHCRTTVDGAVYAKELRNATLMGRIINVPYEPTKPVHTFWDLGWRDFTAIWFAQSVGFEYRILRYIEAHHTTVAEFVKMFQTFDYVYGVDYLPHDAEASQLSANGRTIKKMMQGLGRTVKIIPIVPIATKINAARVIFPQCFFDEANCAQGIERLRRYKFEVDEETGLRDKVPLHDENSHGASAFEYLALSIKGEAGRKRVSKLDIPERKKERPEFGDFVGENNYQSWMS